MLRQQTVDTTPRSLLRLNATKRTWQFLFDPLWLSARLTNTYEDLAASLVHALGNYPNPVLSRHDDGLSLGLPTDPSTTMSLSSAAAVGQTYGTIESVKWKLEYQSRHDAFHEHVERKCELYGIVDGSTKLEVTIFFLALLGMQTFLSHLQPELRDEVVERVGRDLRDPWIAREAGAIRRQMESVEGCYAAEGGCNNCCNQSI